MTKQAEEERMEDLGQQGDEEKKARKEREGWKKEDAHVYYYPGQKNTETTAHPRVHVRALSSMHVPVLWHVWLSQFFFFFFGQVVVHANIWGFTKSLRSATFASRSSSEAVCQQAPLPLFLTQSSNLYCFLLVNLWGWGWSKLLSVKPTKWKKKKCSRPRQKNILFPVAKVEEDRVGRQLKICFGS